ncbi:MAG: class I SAM-dependent methyltransferase [Bacteroidota bacterium]
MDHQKETAETWNKVADFYQERFMDLNIYNQTYDTFCETVTKPNAHILEIGCGPGNITKYIVSRRPDFRIDAIDIAPNMVALAKQNNPSIAVSVMDCRDINQLTSKYDGIICGFCLPYLSVTDSEKLFKNMAHLLQDKGTLYLSFMEGTPEQSGYQTNSRGDRMYFEYYTLDWVIQQLIINGFSQPDVIKIPFQKADGSMEEHTILIADF